MKKKQSFRPLFHFCGILILAGFTGTSRLPAQEADVLDFVEIEEPTIEGPSGIPEPAGKSPFRFIGEGGLIHQVETDFDNGGDFSVNRLDVGLAFGLGVTESLRWTHTLFSARNAYDFDGGGFSAPDPWEDINHLRYGTQLSYRINEKWGARVGGVFMFAAEEDADWADAFTGGVTLGVDYRASRNFFVSLGLAVISQIEDDTQVVPTAALNWQVNEQWLIRVGALPVSGGALAGAEAEYQLNEHWELGFGLLYHERRFRLDDSGVAPEGVGEEDNLAIRFRAGWRLHPQITLHGEVGIATGGEVDLRDAGGSSLSADDYDPAPYFGVRVVGRF